MQTIIKITIGIFAALSLTLLGSALNAAPGAHSCDLQKLTVLEAEFRTLNEKRREDISAVTEKAVRVAAKIFISESERCYSQLYKGRLSGHSTTGHSIDEGGVILTAPGNVEFASGNFVDFGTKWGADSPFTAGTPPGTTGGTVSYSFIADGVDNSDESSDANVSVASLPGYTACFDAEIVMAFAAWSAVANIQFVQVADNGLPFNAVGATGDIRIGTHSFDGPSGTLAHGFYPPPNGSSAAGDMHFDKGEAWSCTAAGGIDIGVVAIHELGHNIGLNHEPSPPLGDTAIMNPFYNPSLSGLQTDDIDGGVAIYGALAGCNGEMVTVDLNMGESPTNDDDVILGTPGDDIINALKGDDVVCAGAGNDIVNGNGGMDTIFGEDGDDQLSGNQHADVISGGNGMDTINGGGGEDEIRGDADNDTLIGGSAADNIFGGTGDDFISAGIGADLVQGNEGNDELYGGDGFDTMRGDDGDDFIRGGARGDDIRGGAGNDDLGGNAGDDTLFGNAGNDTLNGGRDNDTLSGGQDSDVCTLGATGPGDSADASCEVVN